MKSKSNLHLIRTVNGTKIKPTMVWVLWTSHGIIPQMFLYLILISQEDPSTTEENS